MAGSPLGRTLLIANPAAHSGKGAAGADFARHFLGSFATATRGYEVRLTQGPGDAAGIAAGAVGFDTVLALGGDGVIHEVVNGLMRLPQSARPQLGIIPLGSGNDYARTLGMMKNDVEGAFAQRSDSVSLTGLWEYRIADKNTVEASVETWVSSLLYSRESVSYLSSAGMGENAQPYPHQPQLLFRRDGGHGMVFRRLDGQLLFVLHAPNDTPNERPALIRVEEQGDALRRQAGPAD